MSLHVTELHELVALVLGLAGLGILVFGVLQSTWWSYTIVAPVGLLAMATSAVLLDKDIDRAEVGGMRFRLRVHRHRRRRAGSMSTQRRRRRT